MDCHIIIELELNLIVVVIVIVLGVVFWTSGFCSRSIRKLDELHHFHDMDGYEERFSLRCYLSYISPHKINPHEIQNVLYLFLFAHIVSLKVSLSLSPCTGYQLQLASSSRR